MTTEILRSLGACSEAVNWARQYPDPQAAWDACPQGDWMLWYWERCIPREPWSEERKPLVRATCTCARQAWEWMPAASLIAVEKIEAWTQGAPAAYTALTDATDAAAHANAVAYDSRYAFRTDAVARAAVAAEAAVGAASCTYDAIFVINVSCAVTFAARAAARAAAYSYVAPAYHVIYTAAHRRMFSKCANIIRAQQPVCPQKETL